MKGAAIVDLIIVIVMISVFFISAVIVQSVWTDITSEDEVFTEQATIKGYTDQAMSSFDFLGVFMFGGALISILIISFMQESHPVFLAISIIVLIVSIPVMAITSNSMMSMVTTDTAWAAEAEEMPMSTDMIGNLALFGVIGGFLVLVALYAKFGGGR